MAEIRLTKVEQGQTKIRNVPIAVTPEGFWCCPSPVVFQKTIKAQNPLNKTKPSSPPPKTTVQKKRTPINERKAPSTPLRSSVVSDDQRNCGSDTPGVSASIVSERTPSDMKVVLLGKQGFCVKLSVHKNVLVENSSFFADKLSEEESNLSCLEIDDCEDVEIYVETVGLMYCKEMKQRLIKQSVSRVLRILKVFYWQ
ncbi:BTB/POZ DOMAIN PROTEIN [Salix purpurea]|uniref:BTB/POZ DOMAIN PROTEIN n=1 Tax=Salix purpurea TaxID=77065 RepID=A0A9Q0ZMT6_SALPP|nr:BTB/POZ DOMAIN PROTEIN [Salix purpurea]